MIVLGLDSVLLLHQLLVTIREHAGYCQLYSMDNMLYVEAHDVFRCSMYTIQLEITTTVTALVPMVIDIRTFIRCLSNNVTVCIRQDAKHLHISDANTKHERLVTHLLDHVPYQQAPYVLNRAEYVSIRMYSRDFISISNHLCLGNGIAQISLKNRTLVFETACDYGTIRIEKQIDTSHEITHAHIVAKHLRCIPVHVRQIEIFIALTEKKQHLVGISAGSYMVWLHAFTQDSGLQCPVP
jgi:hypothetical protein